MTTISIIQRDYQIKAVYAIRETNPSYEWTDAAFKKVLPAIGIGVVSLFMPLTLLLAPKALSLADKSINPISHYYWLIEFVKSSNPKNLNYISIGYIKKGIYLNPYLEEDNLSFNDVLLRRTTKVFKLGPLKTNRKWNEIRMKVESISDHFNSNNFNTITNNCRSFFEELGLFMLDDFEGYGFFSIKDYFTQINFN